MGVFYKEQLIKLPYVHTCICINDVYIYLFTAALFENS